MLLHIMISPAVNWLGSCEWLTEARLGRVERCGQNMARAESARSPLIRKLHGVLILDIDRIPGAFSCV